jgi:hypothetical protein
MLPLTMTGAYTASSLTSPHFFLLTGTEAALIRFSFCCLSQQGSLVQDGPSGCDPAALHFLIYVSLCVPEYVWFLFYNYVSDFI